MAGQEVLEGFLCPLCMKDLGDVIQLQVHFEESHSKEDQAFVQSLKDLFGKAKKKIASYDSEPSEQLVSPLKLTKTDLSVHPVSGVRLDLCKTGEEGVKRNHFAEFKKIRSSRVDRYATETNRLIVRLDKLLTNIPGEAAKRRDHEVEVVPWIDEDLVKLCPTCAKGFNIARRKHHCRLCGSVMCQDCSTFVDFDFCRRLTNPVSLSSYKPVERLGWAGGKSDTKSVGSPARPSIFKLRRSGSRESVNSMMSMVESRTKEEFRSCTYCKVLLTHRETIIDLQTTKPIVSQFYDSLRTYMASGEELSPRYVAMHASLVAGETTYQAGDVKMLRVKLLKIAENIDLMSKKIASLGRETVEEGAPLPRRFLLQTQIRRASVNLIKDTLVGLPSLPGDDELARVQQERREQVARRVEEERKKAAEARLKFQNMQERKRSDNTPSRLNKSNSAQKFNQSNVSYESGFVLSSSAHAHVVNSVNEDPMVQQMNIIRGYIQQAREASRFDEVNMLESNLRDLQEEFKRQHPPIPSPLREENSTTTTTDSSYVSFSRPGVEFDEKRGQLVTNGEREEGAKNPFGEDREDSEDEYDASGKNPFAE